MILVQCFWSRVRVIFLASFRYKMRLQRVVQLNLRLSFITANKRSFLSAQDTSATKSSFYGYLHNPAFKCLRLGKKINDPHRCSAVPIKIYCRAAIGGRESACPYLFIIPWSNKGAVPLIFYFIPFTTHRKFKICIKKYIVLKLNMKKLEVYFYFFLLYYKRSFVN